MAVGDLPSAGRRHKNTSAQRNNAKREGFDVKKRGFAGVRRRPDDPEPPSDTNYRNRALERSKMTDDYYKRVEEEYRLLKTQTEEESRYMGGDEEHTHLVKGLDYVLLEKVRKSLAPRTAAQKAAEASLAKEEENNQHTDFGMYIYRTFFHHTHLHNRHFYERLNNTYRLLSKGYKFKRNNVEAGAARIFYSFDLRMEPGPNDIPSTVIFNDGHKQHTGGLLSSHLDPDLKKELFDAFEWHEENRKRKKEDRLPFRPEINVNTYGGDDDDDDIFAGAGEYNSEELNPEVVSKLKENEKYFADSDDDNDDDGASPPPPLKAFVRRQRHNVTASYDGYDECYPCAGDADSDDEGKGGNKKSKGNRAEWRKIEKIIADKKTISMDQLEHIAGSKKSS